MVGAITYESVREVRTYADLSHGADVMLRIAREQPAGRYYTAMSSLLLRAFTFEAYLNHAGARLFPFWESIDSIRVMDKCTVVCSHLGLSPDMGSRPYQTLRNLFRFRNAIGHGKSVILTGSQVLPVDAELTNHIPQAEWEEYASIENAERAAEDVSVIVNQIHAAAGWGPYAFTHAPTITTGRIES